MEKLVTILTPTYNRNTMLKRLYESLLMQTVKNFVWLIVDDGSKDETANSVRQWQREKKIEILYIYQKNGGKHRALNKGIEQIRTELSFIVDSDDYLPEDAVEIIGKYHEKYKNMKNLCGYSFLRCYEDGTVNTAYFPKDEMIGTFRDIRINGNIGGDKAEVFITEILRLFPFPEWEGERFVPEDIVWMQMSGNYLMVHVNQCIYISEYLEGGLTKSGRRMKIHSAKAMIYRSQIYLADSGVNRKMQLKMMLLYIIYGKFDHQTGKQLFSGIHNKKLFVIAYFPANVLYASWKIKYKKEK